MSDSVPEINQPCGASLTPEKDVVFEGGRFISSSREPWLTLSFARRLNREAWLELVFEADFNADPARPVLRAVHADGETDWILPAPILGRAIWRGRAPDRVEHWSISPVDRKGPFNFRIVSVRTLSLWRRLWLCGRLKSAAMGLGLTLLRRRRRADLFFCRKLRATRLSHYAAWRDERRRSADWAGFDKVEVSEAALPRVRFLRVVEGAPIPAAIFGLSDGDYVALAQPGDIWSPDAAAIVAVSAMTSPTDVIYADEEIAGGRSEPWFKPAWDPVFARTSDVTGRARFFSVSVLRQCFSHLTVAALSEVALSGDANLTIRHIPRLLLTTGALERRPIAVPARPAAPPPPITVIIPTRDRWELLRKCVESLRREHAAFAAIIVDNGSEQAATQQYLNEVVADARFQVLARPGPFNFSRLCNAAAALATTPALLLLNNDIEATTPGWLGELAAWTNDPAVGAAAPKLLYPNGAVQHGGVILGIEGGAGHFEYGVGADDPGYFGRLSAPFSSSAVTGACMAVSREKFLAVGGFDEVNLPVELNDIDFCLRLAERGWRNIVDGRIRLLHCESASRGRTGVASERYPQEWGYFRRRWMARLRSDPAFSPGLSLDSTRPALS